MVDALHFENPKQSRCVMCDELNFHTELLSIFALGFALIGTKVFVQDFRANWPTNRAELLQPWKLVTLAIGTSWLLYGAITYRFADWDIGASLIMAGITYLVSPWCARAVFYREWHKMAGVIVMSWWAVDGSYAVWHTLAGNAMMRDANLPASGALFWLCGFIWLPQGTLRNIIGKLAAWQTRKTNPDSPTP